MLFPWIPKGLSYQRVRSLKALAKRDLCPKPVHLFHFRWWELPDDWISRELAFPEPAFNLKDQLLEMGCALRLVPALCLCQASHRIKVRGQRRSIHPLPQTFVLHFA
jgi:hypothetical protein